ncbi:outer membrane beta-barrel family protein [Pontibacter sp. SGAir0037]|uniref:outer membrane beta-barrel family protein n=1 Tax=Pontibacter sp. SGAir0037 TaxID=2571030 RepID=UPI0010CCF6D6|nr:outer membrane beta-barrel family protein [Pontibacter sp. SGAir0037]QCR22513.1 TonB-dependent receptor [Pontibacter sp. SGAir0037]
MKKRILLFLLGQLCLFLTPGFTASAQIPASAKGQIAGTLTDSLTGKPVAYATVALLQQGKDQAIQSTLSDGQGQFSFGEVSEGEYELAIRFLGYKNKSIRQIAISATRQQQQVGTIALAPQTTQLKEVEVQALRPTITHEADKMVVSIEGTALAAGRTAYDVLSRVPGVFVDQDGNIQLNGRSGVTVMLNGKLTYLSASDLRTMLEGMSAENIRNIEIITNPSAKYDAEGSSGILNINLKKNDLRGINGSVYVNSTYNFKQAGYATGGNINYKSGRFNSFLSLDQMKRIGNREGTFTREFYGEQTTYFDQVAAGNHKNLGPPTFRAGTDFELNDKHSIGGMASLNDITLWMNFNTDTYIGAGPAQPETFIEADNFTNNRFVNLTTNLHYVGKLDTAGTTLSADLDLVKIANRGYSEFNNYTRYLLDQQPEKQEFLYTDTDNGFTIYAAKIDFTRPLSKEAKLEAGVKASQVVSDNDSRFYIKNDDALTLDRSRTNHFLYDERIYAAYLNVNGKLGERYTVQAGLRAEQTASEGKSLTTGQVTDREYLNFFPSIFVQQKIDENYQISYSYSRRIQRPNYGNLNPFIIYRDPYTYVQGNPQLRPQYTQAIGITQTFKKVYSLVFNYQYVQDVMAELPVLDVENATTIYTTGNVDNLQNISLAAIAPFKILKNWDTNNTLTLNYSEYSMPVNEERVVNAQLLYMLQSTHNILLPKGIQVEATSVFRGPVVSGLYKIAPMWWVHLGLRKSFLDKKLDLSINMNDVFRTYRIRFDTRIGRNINDFDQYFYARNLGITLRYNFSRGQKFDSKRRNSNLDEVNRAG